MSDTALAEPIENLTAAYTDKVASFVHLRLHSAYSLSEGAMRVKEIPKLCQNDRMPAVAVTDTGNLFGTLEFTDACAGAGIQPIMGCLLNIRREDIDPSVLARGGRLPDPDHVVLLAKDEAGWANLVKLSSHAYQHSEPGEEPAVSFDVLKTYSDGLVCLSGGPQGPVGRLLVEGKKGAALETAKIWKELFGDRYYIEVMRHGLPDEVASEAGHLEIAYDLDIPLVATNDVFFPDESMYEAHDALLCIADGAYINMDVRRRLTKHHRFKTSSEMLELFRDLPEATANTLEIARRCAIRSPKRAPILPRFGSEDVSEEDILRQMAKDGLGFRLENHIFDDDVPADEREEAAKEYWERLDFELGIINQMGFPGYFLIVADFIQWAKDQGIPVGPGRGSGAGSLVAYVLLITDLDPLRFSLLFERFLNPERVSMPDFDIDFCQDRRGEVIKYVQDKYGYDQVAQIITFGKLQARMAVRDVGRVLEMPYGQVDKLCKMIPNDPGKQVALRDAIAQEPLLRDAARKEENVKNLLDVAQQLEGLYRNSSTHAAGVVIGDRPLDELVALYRDPKSDMPVTQYNMKFVEQVGLVKFDFLGLKTLTVLSRAAQYTSWKGVEINYETMPLKDKASFDMLGRGDAGGVFQLESEGMRKVLRDMKPDTFEDIIAVVALYRPGPMDNIPTYIEVKKGRLEADYMHPMLEEILKETYGIIVYQEQVMQIAQVMAGYSLGGADLLRRAMGKKIAEEMEKQRGIFVDGSVANNVDAAKAGDIFDKVQKFASYGFNKSHAAAYALVAWHTAYMKCHHPVEFFAAIMTYDMGNTDKLGIYRNELTDKKIGLLPPDVNKSAVDFVPEYEIPNQPRDDEKGAIRYALAAIKGIGSEAMQSVVEEREKNGPYVDLFDFAERLDPQVVNRRQWEALAKAGGFDSLCDNRLQILDSVDTLLRFGQMAKEARESSQVSMFGDGSAIQIEKPRLAEEKRWKPADKLKAEFSAIGFYLTAHPLDSYLDVLQEKKVKTLRQVSIEAPSGKSAATIAGTVISTKFGRTKKDKPMCRITASDSTGIFEVMMFSEVLETARDHLEAGRNLVLGVSVEKSVEGGGGDEDDAQTSVSFLANSVTPVERFLTDTGGIVHVEIVGDKALSGLQSLLEDNRGRSEIRLVLQPDDDRRKAVVRLPGRYSVTPDLKDEIGVLTGAKLIN